jgi:hypothetical protein
VEVVKMCCTGSREAAIIEAPTRRCMFAHALLTPAERFREGLNRADRS